MDNCTVHLTTELFYFDREQKLKVLFNTPYRSNFNVSELSFKDIKRNTYTFIYNTREEIVKIIEDILNGEKIKESLKYFFK